MRDELREATVASESMQRLTQIAAAEDAVKLAELEKVRACIAQGGSRQQAADRSRASVVVSHIRCVNIAPQMHARRSELETEALETSRQLAAVERDESNHLQKVAALDAQHKKRLDHVDSQLTLASQELQQARAGQIQLRMEMDDALRSEARREHAARLEAGMLREHIAEQDAVNESYRERSSLIEAEARQLAAQLAHFHA